MTDNFSVLLDSQPHPGAVTSSAPLSSRFPRNPHFLDQNVDANMTSQRQLSILQIQPQQVTNSAPASATGSSAPLQGLSGLAPLSLNLGQNLNLDNNYILRVKNIPSDLTYREATIIFALVIDHVVKIELNSAESVITAHFNNFNTCLTTFKLLNQKCIFGNDVPISVEIDETPNFDFGSLSLRNGVVPNGSLSGRSRFSFNDPFQEFDKPEHDAQQPLAEGASGPVSAWSNGAPQVSQVSQNSSQPQTPINNLNFEWGQSNSASLASKNASSNRRSSSAFFQSNFSNNLLSNNFLNSNLNPVLNQQPLGQMGLFNAMATGAAPSLLPTSNAVQPQGQSLDQLQSQASQLQNQPQSQSQPGSVPSNPQTAAQTVAQTVAQSVAQSQSQPQSQSDTSAQSQTVSVPSQTNPQSQAAAVSVPPQSQSQVEAPQAQSSNASLSLPTPTATSNSPPNPNQPSSQTQSSITSPVEQGATTRKDIPDLSLLARVPPPANPADQNPPCNTLYVGNLPPDATEQELRALFSPQKGFRRLSFRTKTNSSGSGSNNHGPMCFVEFEDVAHATRALAELYGRILPRSSSSNGKGGIRLSFSKNPLGVRGSQRRQSSNQVNNGSFNYNYHMKP